MVSESNSRISFGNDGSTTDAVLKTISTMLLHSDRCEAYHNGKLMEMMRNAVDDVSDNIIRLKTEEYRVKYLVQVKSLHKSLFNLFSICGANIWPDGELGLTGRGFITVGLVFHPDERDNEYSWGTWSVNS
jgi:hypothetical protein